MSHKPQMNYHKYYYSINFHLQFYGRWFEIEKLPAGASLEIPCALADYAEFSKNRLFNFY